jgi:hypothetical protein
MIVVPALAHAEQRGERHISPLHARASHFPSHRPAMMREMTDQPMPGH